MSDAICAASDCVKRRRKTGYCGMHYERLRRTGSLDLEPKPTPEERFWAKVRKTDTCWLWTGGTARNGYGKFMAYTNPVTYCGAHRFAYEMLRGPIPEGLHLDHLCRVPGCVNPDHLEPVTQGENTRRGLTGYGMRKLCRKGLHDVTDPSSWYIARTTGRRRCGLCKRDSDRRCHQRPTAMSG